MESKTPVLLIARILLALMFILAGFGKLTGLTGTAGYIASKGLPMPMVLGVLVGVLELVGGLAIAIGLHARLAALALALFTLLAAVLFHDFWTLPAGQQMVQQLMFMKNLSIAGGLLLVYVFGAGQASVDSRRLAAA